MHLLGMDLRPLAPLWSSLRAKFITVIVIVQISVMGLATAVVEHRQRETILQESLKRATSLASSLAALSEGYMMSYNYVKLEQTVENIAAEEDVAYAIVHTHNGKIAAYSGHGEKQGQILHDQVSQQALRTRTPLTQMITSTALKGRGYDVSIPVFAPGGTRKWGTVRVGYSLASAMHEIEKTSRNLVLLSLLSIALGTLVAIFLALRISRPIQRLVTGVDEVAKGNYDHSITVMSQDEVGYLAGRFEDMRKALRSHVMNLAEEKERLEQANKTILATQEQLIQSEKLAAVGKLSAKVAHEVNNPLAIIKTSVHIINKQMADDDPNKENLDIVEEEIARIARIIKQLIASARPKTEIAPVDVNEVIRKLMKLATDELASQGVESELDLTANLPLPRLSLDQFKQVLLNLIKNAREAMPDGGILRIETARQQGGLSIRVTDTGMGIPEEHLSRLFQPFFSTKQQTEGTGLGLSVCQSIINNFGGFIEVDSQLGQGTMFRIFLPEYSPHLIGASEETPKEPLQEPQKEVQV